MTIRQLPSPRRLWPAIPLLAAVLRVVNLGGRALWYDEAFSVLFARRSVGALPLLLGLVVSVMNLIVDLLYPLLDPRIGRR